MWQKIKHQKVKNEIDAQILTITQNKNSLIQESVTELVKSGGKRLRPLLVILAAEFGESDKNKIYKIAAGIEILHMSTLVHDDVIDNAAVRRGAETAHKKFGSKTAVFIGDYLLVEALEIFEENLSSYSKSKLLKLVKLICAGEISQYSNKFNYELTKSDYFRRIRKKTALFFAYSIYLGAYESNLRGENLYHLYKFGLEMGMAFQIEDDLLDFKGDETLSGKKLNQDLKDGIYTLPIILLLEAETTAEKTVQFLKNKDYQAITTLIQQENKIEASRRLVKKFIERAKIHLSQLPVNEVKKELLQIIEQQLKRKY